MYQQKRNLKIFQKKILSLINYKNIKKLFKIIIIIVILYNFLFYAYLHIFPNLKIYFIDVGQGDSSLIITPNNKSILIDGGEAESDVLLSYLLDRRIKKIDYMIISHFDSDHVRWINYSFRRIKSKKRNYR